MWLSYSIVFPRDWSDIHESIFTYGVPIRNTYNELKTISFEVYWTCIETHNTTSSHNRAACPWGFCIWYTGQQLEALQLENEKLRKEKKNIWILHKHAYIHTYIHNQYVINYVVVLTKLHNYINKESNKVTVGKIFVKLN